MAGPIPPVAPLLLARRRARAAASGILLAPVFCIINYIDKFQQNEEETNTPPSRSKSRPRERCASRSSSRRDWRLPSSSALREAEAGGGGETGRAARLWADKSRIRRPRKRLFVAGVPLCSLIYRDAYKHVRCLSNIITNKVVTPKSFMRASCFSTFFRIAAMACLIE